LLASAEVRAAEVRLADVLDPAGLPAGLRRYAPRITVARFGRGQARLRLTGRIVAERVRAAMPAAAAWLPSGLLGEVIVLRSAETARPQPAVERPCLRALKAIAAGAIPLRSDFDARSCEGAARPALHYDARAQAVRADRDIAQGEDVAFVPASALPDLAPGAQLVLTSRVGPVTIRRQVAAAQPGRLGEAVFVRTPEGKLLSVPYGEDGL
jgi:hypothetical protein